MLLYSDFSPSEIASILAFSSQSYFTEVFRKTTGVTPRKYQESFFTNNCPWKIIQQLSVHILCYTGYAHFILYYSVSIAHSMHSKNHLLQASDFSALYRDFITQCIRKIIPCKQVIFQHYIMSLFQGGTYVYIIIYRTAKCIPLF